MVNEAVRITSELCRQFEGLHLKPYLCPAGVPTIGYGATYYEDGTRVTLSDPAISKARAESLLIYTIKTLYLPSVLTLCPGVDTAERLAALTDFAFNLGVGRLRTSTLRRRVNAGDWDGAKVELAKWNKAGGKVLRGLTRRRTAEIALI